jgi:hypothetical protein
MTDSLFDKVIAASELSPLFAKTTVERALRRGGVNPETLTRQDLRRASSELRRSLVGFLGDRIDAVMAKIDAL